MPGTRSLKVLYVPTLVLLFGIISTTFSLLAATSPRWAVQQYFYAPISFPDASTYVNVTCQAQRSPFCRCGIPLVDVNGTCRIPPCHFYPPRGRNRTSCRVAAEVGSQYEATVRLTGVIGQYAECQQVHMAGNLQIAASAFTGVGLLLAIVLQLVALVVALAASSAEESQRESGVSSRAARILTILTTGLVLSLVVGSLLQVLAQFFGVLGLSVMATPTAASANTIAPRGFTHFGASDWMLDLGLTRYASVAWVFALAGAVVASSLFFLGCRS